jgi:thioredoxin-dependent peroxiredoxin
MPEVGQPAPPFTLAADTGETISLEGLRGRPVVLYFYPKDDTPGCTTQACGLRDAWHDLTRTGAEVFGISADDVESHQRFREKYHLPFRLLSDTDRSVIEDYGVWVEKNRYGKKSMGIERSTFIVGPDGNVAAMKRRVKPDEHADWAIAQLAALGEGTPAR